MAYSCFYCIMYRDSDVSQITRRTYYNGTHEPQASRITPPCRHRVQRVGRRSAGRIGRRGVALSSAGVRARRAPRGSPRPRAPQGRGVAGPGESNGKVSPVPLGRPQAARDARCCPLAGAGGRYDALGRGCKAGCKAGLTLPVRHAKIASSEGLHPLRKERGGHHGDYGGASQRS